MRVQSFAIQQRVDRQELASIQKLIWDIHQKHVIGSKINYTFNMPTKNLECGCGAEIRTHSMQRISDTLPPLGVVPNNQYRYPCFVKLCDFVKKC